MLSTLPMSTVAELDARITKLEMEIIRLKAERNAYSLLCRLPNEVLVCIAKGSTSLGRGRTSASLQDVYKMTWICRSVRAALLSAQELWSNVDITRSDEVVDQFLGRAPSCTLNLWSHRYSRKGDLERLARCLPRAVSLMFTNLDLGLFAPLLQEERSVPAEFLQILRIRKSYTLLKRRHMIYPVMDVLICTNLHTLDVSGFDVLATIPELPSLRHLTMRQTFISLEDFRDFCEQTVLLEKVILDNAVSKDLPNEADMGTIAQLELHHLTHLTLRGRHEVVKRLLELFPSPKFSMNISVVGFNRFGRSSWSSTIGCNAYIMARLSEFWEQHPQRPGSYPSGKTTFHSFRWGVEKVTVDFSSAGIFDYHCANDYVTAADPWLDRVANLIIDFASYLPAFTSGVEDYVNWTILPNVEHLAILHAKDHDSNASETLGRVALLQTWSLLEKWIIGRHEEGRSLQTIKFSGCGDAVKPIFERLVASAVAHSITWTDGVEGALSLTQDSDSDRIEDVVESDSSGDSDEE